MTWALAADAIKHPGRAKVSRLPSDVCAHPYGPGLDEAATTQLLQAADSLAAGRYADQPKVRREPRLRAWVKK